MAEKPEEIVVPPAWQPWTPAFWDPWEGSLELGLSGTEGNSETFNVRFGLTAKHKTDHLVQSLQITSIQKSANDRVTANTALIEALRWFDFEGGGEAALEIVLREAAVRDSLTLWHLLVRTSGEARGRVFDRLAVLMPPPSGVTRENVMQGDTQAMNAWRDEMVWSPGPLRFDYR